MKFDVLVEGESYISASQAAKKTGYTSDYIGQICRTKKIPSKMVGRTWYVDPNALINYKQNKHIAKSKNEKVTILNVKNSLLGKIYKNGLQFNYQADRKPLFPEPNKISIATKKIENTHRKVEIIGIFVSLLMIVTISFVYAEAIKVLASRQYRESISNTTSIYLSSILKEIRVTFREF